MKDRIEHQGIIYSIEGTHIRVSILQVAACSECKAKSLCTSSESKQKFIDVYDSRASEYRVGDNVKVCGTLTMGKQAVRLAFGGPLAIILFTAPIASSVLHFSEPQILLVLTVFCTTYFLSMYLLRNRLSRHFAFWIEK